MKYTIGLDLGTTSVGWAVIDNDNNRIHDLGVRIFESAENPKDGKSLAEPRRLARSTRRRLGRRRGRLDAVKTAFISTGMSTNEIERALSAPNSPYRLRSEGLDRVLTPAELFISVYHITKRRGYKSNRKREAKSTDQEKKQVLQSIAKTRKKLEENPKIRTVGELLYQDILAQSESSSPEGVRNKSGSYRKSVSREMLEEELTTLFSAQQKLGNSFVTDELIQSIIGHDKDGNAIGAFNYQKHYAQGEALKKMVGFCTFENVKNGRDTNEMRAPKATFTFQFSSILQKVNHITLSDVLHPKEAPYPLSTEQRKLATEYCLSTKTPTYKGLRKELGLSENIKFNMVQYVAPFDKKNSSKVLSEKEIMEIAEGKTKLPSASIYLELKKIIQNADEKFWESIDSDKRIIDQIATALTLYRTDVDILQALDGVDLHGVVDEIPDSVKNALLPHSYSQFGRLSLKALTNILPYLEKGLRYDEAIESAGYSEFTPQKSTRLSPLPQDDHTITNPVVKRSISQTIKVLNAIIDKYGSPYAVHIELARELSKTKKERDSISQTQKKNQDSNQEAIESIQKIKLHRDQIQELYDIEQPKGQEIIKYRLWKEQNSVCAYSGSPIEEHRLFEDGYVEIDHIIPFSRSFDDSYTNKVLALKKENQNKGNRLPFEYLGQNENRWEQFTTLISSFTNISPRKRKNLLTKKFVLDGLTSRTLNDTRYIAKYLKNYIERGLIFTEGADKKRVLTVNGMATAYLRKRWTIHKNRQASDTHHAQDAVIVAVVNDRIVQRIAQFSKFGEVKDYLALHKSLTSLPDIDSMEAQELQQRLALLHSNSKQHFPEPWDGFHHELIARMSDNPQAELRKRREKITWMKNVDEAELSYIRPIFVSRMPRRKVTGSAHKDTLRSPKNFKQGQSSVRTPLTSLTRKNLIEKGVNLDPKLREALLDRLSEFGDDAKKAFSEPFYKTMKNGQRGPLVRSVKLVDSSQKSGLLINNEQALVDQDSMVRIDVFAKPNKKGKLQYYFVPIYAFHRTKKSLPNIALPSGEVMEESDFVFSLYKNDLVRITKKRESELWYYINANIANGGLTFENHNRTLNRVLGIKTLDKFEKYVVDLLGNYHKVTYEPRLPLHSPK